MRLKYVVFGFLFITSAYCLLPSASRAQTNKYSNTVNTNAPSMIRELLPTPSPTPQANSNTCKRSGCSGQLCVSADSPEFSTTCEMRPEYLCYQQATCEAQADGSCGFTETAELQACLAQSKKPLPSGPEPREIIPTPQPEPISFPRGQKMNMRDYSQLFYTLRKRSHNRQHDFNNDGVVNIKDFSIMNRTLQIR